MTTFRLEGPVERAARAVRRTVREAAERARERGLGVPDISGKLLRPMVARALIPADRRDEADHAFASGALAIQLVHEASLLHDDILDDADRRRGAPTLQSRSGVEVALVAGDRYLTSAYVVAGDVGSAGFVAAFSHAVERTVEGEMRQGTARGRILSEEEYEGIIRGKSGALFGAAAELAAVLGGSALPELGLRIGSLYQRVDDLLDYCTEVEQDKPALQDWRQRKWTFPLGLAGIDDWDRPEAEVLAALRRGREPALLRGVEALETRAAAIVGEARTALGEAGLLTAILDAWCAAARRSVQAELSAAARATPAPRHDATQRSSLEQAS